MFNSANRVGKQENVKQIILHLVENYREKMSKITYVDTFSVLILRNDQMQDSTLPSNYPSEVDRTPRLVLIS